jgi:NMD protein affecting ribosome stability and mRNA decay
MIKQLQIIFLSCQKATLLIEMSHEKPLSFSKKIQLKVHLSLCDRCNRYQKQSLLIETILKSNYKAPLKTNGLKLSDASKTRLKKVIEENMKNK